MTRISVNGVGINYLMEGPAGAPVITMSHSLVTDLGMWAEQAAAFRDRYRVLRFDTRGHGLSDAPEGPYSLEDLAADAKALLDALDIAQTHFVGLSMGGMIGQTLALNYPEALLSLTLCDTASRMPPAAAAAWSERIGAARTQGLESQVAPSIERWFTPEFVAADGATIAGIEAMIRATPVAGFIGCCAAISGLDFTARLDGITAPTLVVVGEDDPGTPVEVARVIHDGIAGSDLVIIKSARHLSNVEQPGPFNAALAAFLDRVEAAS